MEKIKKYFKNIPSENIKNLCQILEIKQNSSIDSIIKNITSYTGIDRLFKKFGNSELSLINELLNSDGLTFTEINRSTKIPIQDIENSSEKLKNSSIVFILKNRKHLNNKLDKITLFDPIREMLNPLNKESFNDVILKESSPSSVSSKYKKLITLLNKNGNICTLSFLEKEINSDSFEKIIRTALENGIIKIFHRLKAPFETIISTDIFLKSTAANSVKLPDVDNMLNIFNNLFYSYDIISTYGLYFTQKDLFRKVDKRRITENIIPLLDKNGNKLNEDTNLDLILAVFEKMESIKLYKNSLHIMLDYENLNLKDPHCVLKELFIKKRGKTEIFSNDYIKFIDNDFEIKTLKSIFENSDSLSIEFFKTLLIFNFQKETLSEFSDFVKNLFSIKTKAEMTLDLLILFGFCRIKAGEIILNDTGSRILFNKKSDIAEKSIYINPNLTLMIPKDSISSIDLFKILNYTQIVKNDVMLEVQINKETILKALKRNMDTTSFIHVIEANSKNDLPQNLDFLISEWISQIHHIDIGYTTLLKTNDIHFIDKLIEGNKKFIIEKINNNYAVIDRDMINEIIKFSETENTLINIHDELKFTEQ